MTGAAATSTAMHPPVPRPSVIGIILISIWLVIFAGLIAAFLSSITGERLGRYGPLIVSGFFTTIKLVTFSILIGAVISFAIAAGRLSRNPFVGALTYAYSYFFRGTPLIAQTFLIYYGAGQFALQLRAIGLWWFFRDAYDCAILAFALNTAAYQGEILSGAIRAVSGGQREAAAALGLHHFVTLRKIVLPQAVITALRPYGNEIVTMIKSSAIASIITVLDLMGETRYVFSQTYDLSFYLWAAVFYLILVEALRRLSNTLERRLTRHLVRTK
jgi:polar amino acid transport system permease protein